MLRFLCIELSYLQEDEKSNNCDEDKAKYCPLGKDNTMCNFCGINLEACHESFCKHGLSEVRAISTAFLNEDINVDKKILFLIAIKCTH